MIKTYASSTSTVRLAIALAVLALLVGTAIYVQQLGKLQREAESTVQARSALINKLVATQHDRLFVMHDMLLRRYRELERRPPPPLQFQEHPAQGVYVLLPGALELSGTLTGKGRLPLAPEVVREIAAALDMEAQIITAEHLEPDIVWMYYQSANNFIYLSPRTSVKEYHFLPSFYDQRYWQQATPQQNPSRRVILEGPYHDQGGKGWIMTFAKPVYANATFLGVVALDMRTDIFSTLAQLGNAPGESILVSRRGQMVTRQDDSTPQPLLLQPQAGTAGGWIDDGAGVRWLVTAVAQDELWLMHRLPTHALYLAAARESAPAWLLIVLAGLAATMAWRLRRVLAEVTRMTLIDPLTQVFNRRGFFDRAALLTELAARQQQRLALMIMDIDFFKKVNDTYGHGAGDRVLRQMGRLLQGACRSSDVVCRWGGEEFVVLMLIDAGDDAQALAERMRQQAQQVRIRPGNLPLTVSAGLVLKREEESVEVAIQRADELLYQAKSNGRNRIVADLGETP